MDENKFLIVILANNEGLLDTCLQHVNKLYIPPAYRLELLVIRDATGMASGYNRALANNAKYKIYLHQDTFILNQSILIDLLNTFRSNNQLGLIGLQGCKDKPPDGLFWNGRYIVGKYIGLAYGQPCPMIFREVYYAFEPVFLIDGFFMATQYDLPWRDDLFPGFHFYDHSQSIEFIRHGYLVGIPRQVTPWCWHYREAGVLQHQFADWTNYHNIYKHHYGSFLI